VAPFVFQRPVRFADVDHAGIVYYPRFFDYFHQAFEELFRVRMGPTAYLALLDDRKIGFPAVKASCDYRAPLRFGDSVAIELSVARVGDRSVTFRYRALRLREGEADVVAAEGEVVTAVTDLAAFRAVSVPEDLRRMFLELAPAAG
jgi:4-hydroxybenzoyl-CoA thioesterase